MDSLAEHEVYKYKNGRTLDDNEDSMTDVISVGMDHLMKGTNSPLNDYIKAFWHLERWWATKPIVDDTQPLPTEPNPPTLLTSLSPSDPAVCIEVSMVQDKDEGDIDMDGELDDDVLMEEESELMQLLSRANEPTLALATEEDVALDMDRSFIENLRFYLILSQCSLCLNIPFKISIPFPILSCYPTMITAKSSPLSVSAIKLSVQYTGNKLNTLKSNYKEWSDELTIKARQG